METKFTQQEILLNTEAHFAQCQWVERDDPEASGLSSIEKLEKACWDGLVKELIPELDITLQSNKKLWLWQIHTTRVFLALDFSENPGPKEHEVSIDPYLFMVDIRNN